MMNELNENTSKRWQEDTALKRFQLISPLLEDSLDPAKKIQLRERIAQENGISVRSLYRYERAYGANGFTGLKPLNREMHQSTSLPENFDELVAQASQLKREVPSRSVNQIIMILELEGAQCQGSCQEK